MVRPLDTRERAIEVIRLAGLALRHFEVWRVYTEPESRNGLYPALDQFADFVRLDEHAHQELCLLYLGSLFEVNKGTINLRALINEAAAASDQFLVESVRTRFDEASHLISKIHLLRNNAVAHRSAKLSRVTVFARAELSPDELRTLVDDVEQIAYAIGRAFGIEPFTIAIMAPIELNRIFSRLLPKNSDC